MDNENIYTEYNDDKNKIPWLRMIITALVVALVIFIILLLVRNCSKVSLNDDMVEATKEYYEKHPTATPKEVGECYVVTLSTLEAEGLVDSSKYSTCDKNSSYVNVCYLENSRLNYAATVSCEKETTSYDMWKDGEVTDLSEGSDVRFKFSGEEYKLVPEGDAQVEVKYYYPNDTTDINAVDRYYASIPSNEYTGRESETTGYKWYTESTVKSYWNNGEYSATAPNGYVNKDSSKQVTLLSETKPASASYRTIKDVTLYRSRTVAVPYKFICVKPGTTSATSPSVVTSTFCAELKNGFTQMDKAYYTCDGGKTDAKFNQVCTDYTEWTTEACTSNALKGIECQTKSGYQYTDTVYKWYTNSTVRKYYPSNASQANGENTYFVASPVSGAIKDSSTKAQVSKYYKTALTDNVNMVEKWVPVTNGYVDYEELISTFNVLGYEVNSLSDIKALEKLRYEIKMQYRNVEE